MRKIAFVVVALCSIGFGASPARAEGLAPDALDLLGAMHGVYRAEYAPAEWKKKFANYDLDAEYQAATAAIQAQGDNLTVAQTRQIFKQFIYAMRDYHTSISFVSTESASLPLLIKGTDTHFFIVYIDRAKLPESDFPFHVGDEVVTFGGKPTAQAVADLQADFLANVPTTDKALAELALTSRRGARGYSSIPQGPVTLGILPKGAQTVVEHQLIWDYKPETVSARGALVAPPGFKGFDSRPSLAGTGFHPTMSVSVDSPSATPYDIGGRKAFTPDLGTPIWRSADTDLFDAYIFKTAEGKLAGYIRIPQYEAPDYVKALQEFGRDIALFESTTDALVIDQVNNPGGSVFYLYALASMLTTQPLQTPLHRMAITQADVAAALQMIDQLSSVKNDDDAKKALNPGDLDGYTPSYEFVQFQLSYARFVVSEWNAGHKLTEPYWIAGVDHINPDDTHYSKPILLLTNHLDFSGGDFFPTILQDNKRVTILGGRTAGAGGYVNDVQLPNNVGIDKFRVTESIAERVSLNPIENLGVTPDVPYEMTEKDFTENYSPYVHAVLATLGTLTK